MPRQHPIPFDTGEEERLLGPLSISATLWLSAGGLLSYQLAKLFPPLPLPHILGYIHCLIPLGASAIFAFVRYKDMTIMQFVQTWINFRKRKRGLKFEHQNFVPIIVERGEEE